MAEGWEMGILGWDVMGEDEDDDTGICYFHITFFCFGF